MSHVLVLAGSVRLDPAAQRELLTAKLQYLGLLVDDSAHAPPLHSAMVSPALIALNAVMAADHVCLGAEALVPGFASLPATHPA